MSTEKMEFQTEVKQLLDIVINSLYTDKEIFLRELISNAADALEKMRYLSVTEHNIYQPELELQIQIKVDPEQQTILIEDTGVGMSKTELIENLGTIAHSGSKAFLQSLQQENPDFSLIGQFGVGFYAAFMVAQEVVVSTRSY
ncbi:MAG: ATP-binding protein, partial [Clostridia bacterium]|nr:ATP-binding protein [Clostridia bacterium]